MIVVDVETTGVDSRKHSIISIGAIDFDNPSNQFSVECSAYPDSPYEEEALLITGHSKESIFDPNKSSEARAIELFSEWMKSVSDHTIAGQNCYFDLEFLQSAAHRIHKDIGLPRRIVDLHSVVWAHIMSRGDNAPIDPVHKRSLIDSKFITDYVGIPEEVAPHIGINGARWECEAFSRLLYNKSIFDEYKQYKIPWAN